MYSHIDHEKPINSSTLALFELYQSLAQGGVDPYVQVGNTCPKEKIHELSPFLFFIDDLKSHAPTITKTPPEMSKTGIQLLENSEYRFASEILRKRFDISLPAGKFLSYMPGINWLSVKPGWRDNFPARINFKFRDKNNQIQTIFLGNRSPESDQLDYDLSFLDLPYPTTNPSNLNDHKDNLAIHEGETSTREVIAYLQDRSTFLQLSGKDTVNLAFAKNNTGTFKLMIVSDDRGVEDAFSFTNTQDFPSQDLEVIHYLISDTHNGSQSNHRRKNALNSLLSYPYDNALGELGKIIGPSQMQSKFFIAQGINDVFLMGLVLREPRPKNTGIRFSKSDVIRFSFQNKQETDQFSLLLNSFFANPENSILSLLQDLLKQTAQDYLITHPNTNSLLSNMIPDSAYAPEKNVQLTEHDLNLLNQPNSPIPDWLKDLGVATIVSTSK